MSENEESKVQGFVDDKAAEEGSGEVGESLDVAAPADAGTLAELDAEVDPDIASLIYTIRGRQVMIDSDLAMLYGVETGNLNRAAGRNAERFPEDFRFQLASDEWESLLFHFGRAKTEGRGGRRTPPYAYSEQGVAMLSAVLKSEAAVRVSVGIMRAFVEMRRFIASNALLFERMNAVELRQLEYQRTTDERFGRVFDYIEEQSRADAPTQKIFFQGQIYDALSLLEELISKAEREIFLVDGYVDRVTLDILSKKQPGVKVVVWTRTSGGPSIAEVDAFNAQYPTLEVRRTSAFHDRFLVLDGGEVAYHIGASLKDAGKKCFGIDQMLDPRQVSELVARLEE